MRTFLEELANHWAERPFVWNAPDGAADGGVHPPHAAKVLSLAPHPDDPESAAVTLALLARRGCQIHVAVAFLSPGGVDDDFALEAAGRGDRPLPEVKAELRRREQTHAARRFGLPPERLVFLGLERAEGPDDARNAAGLATHLGRVDPDIVVLPCGRDTNRTHAWVWETFRAAGETLAARRGRPLVALGNEDPKTTGMREDLYVCFGEAEAAWKGELLRTHESQQRRNLRERGIGFDERILGVHLEAGKRLARRAERRFAAARPWAEVFEVSVFGGSEGGTTWTTWKPS